MLYVLGLTEGFVESTLIKLIKLKFTEDAMVELKIFNQLTMRFASSSLLVFTHRNLAIFYDYVFTKAISLLQLKDSTLLIFLFWKVVSVITSFASSIKLKEFVVVTLFTKR